MLGIKALADLGARWIGRAVERVPRLTEAMLGKQEGALRELLRQFREGDVDQALRHALPLGGQGGRGGVPSGDGKLPTVDPTYSLQSLLGSGRGPSGIWFGGFDVQAELAREYRKAAEEAERRGDYRRAAYIHGKLLNDFATAAHLLARGGLHRDAAILYLNRLKDLPGRGPRLRGGRRGRPGPGSSTARMAMHAEAGDLLRRVGEEEAAVAEYLLAADPLAADVPARPPGRRRPAPRPGPAGPTWPWTITPGAGRDRPLGHAVPCGLRMADDPRRPGRGRRRSWRWSTRPTRCFRRPGLDGPAGEFYNELAAPGRPRGAGRGPRRPPRPGPDGPGRQAPAGGRRPPGRPGQLASTYLGRSRAWAARRGRRRDPRPEGRLRPRGRAEAAGRGWSSGRARRREPRRIEVGGGVGLGRLPRPDRPARSSSASRPARSTGSTSPGARSSVLDDDQLPVSSMAVDPEGRTLVMLLGEGAGAEAAGPPAPGPLGSAGWTRQVRMIDGPGDFWLTPVMAAGDRAVPGRLERRGAGPDGRASAP